MASKKLLSTFQFPRFASLRSTTQRGFFGPPGRWDPFSDMTTAIREIERNTARMERDIDKFWARSGMDKLVPNFTKFGPLSAASGTHRITLDLHGYKPEDVKISLKERTLMVEAKFEHKDEFNRTYQEWSRQWNLPETADVSKLKSVLDSEGVLTIEAPQLDKTNDGQAKTQEIPIHKE